MQICKTAAAALVAAALLGARESRADDRAALGPEGRDALERLEAGEWSAIGVLASSKQPALVSHLVGTLLEKPDHRLHERALYVLDGLLARAPEGVPLPVPQVLAALGHSQHHCVQAAVTVALRLAKAKRELGARADEVRALGRLLAWQRPEIFEPARDALAALGVGPADCSPEPEAWAWDSAATHSLSPLFDGTVHEIVGEIDGAGTGRATLNGVLVDEKAAVETLRRLQALARALGVGFDGIVVVPGEALAKGLDSPEANEAIRPGESWLAASGFKGTTSVLERSTKRCRAPRFELLDETAVARAGQGDGASLAKACLLARVAAYGLEASRLLVALRSHPDAWLASEDDGILAAARDLVASIRMDRSADVKATADALERDLEAVVKAKKASRASSLGVSLRATVLDPASKNRAVLVHAGHSGVYEEGERLKDASGRELEITLVRVLDRQVVLARTGTPGETTVELEPR